MRRKDQILEEYARDTETIIKSVSRAVLGEY